MERTIMVNIDVSVVLASLGSAAILLWLSGSMDPEKDGLLKKSLLLIGLLFIPFSFYALHGILSAGEGSELAKIGNLLLAGAFSVLIVTAWVLMVYLKDWAQSLKLHKINLNLEKSKGKTFQ